MTTQFAPKNMTTNSAPSPYVASASTESSSYFLANKAFDNVVGSNQYWLASESSGWLKIYIAASWLLDNYSIRVNTIPEATRAPKDWTMEGSLDGTNFSTLDTITNQTGWGSGETRNFVCSSRGVPYTYYRLNISANNGSAILQVGELYLYGDIPQSNTNYLHNRGHNRLDLKSITRLHV